MGAAARRLGVATAGGSCDARARSTDDQLGWRRDQGKGEEAVEGEGIGFGVWDPMNDIVCTNLKH